MIILSLFDGFSGANIALDRAGIKVKKYYSSEIDKYAIQISNKNYPDIIQLGDITKIKGENLPKIDLLIGGSPCFAAGTKIYTLDGHKNIEDVKIGDYVLTHKKRYRKVLKTGFNLNKKTIKVKIQGIEETEVTENHPYYVRTMNRKWDNKKRTSYRFFNNPIWKRAGELEKTDYIGFPILEEEKNSLNITKEEAWIIGRYIADGHTAKHFRKSENRPNDRHWQLILSIGENKKSKFENYIKENNYSLFLHTKTVYRAVFSSKRLVEIVEKNCGCGAKNKYLSPLLLNLPVYLLKELLEGYLSGDGFQKNDCYRATTISSNLIRTLNLAIAKVYKVNSSFEFTKRPPFYIIEGRKVNQNNTYVISFRKEIKKQSNAFVDAGYIWLPFKSKKTSGNIITVYNIEVEEDNSYTANNAIVHNCQGFSFAGKQLNFEDPRSKLFFEYVRLLEECKPKYFLLENVKMKKEYQNVISSFLKVEPIKINSALVSAQNRERLYWCNWEVIQPKNKNIFLKDIVFDDALFCDRVVGRRLNEQGIRKDYSDIPIKQRLELRTDNKSGNLTTVQKDNMILKKEAICMHNLYGGFKEKEHRIFIEKSPTIRTAAGGGHIPSLLLSENALKYMDRKIKDGRNHWEFNHHSDVRNPKSATIVANFFKSVPYNVLKDWNCIRKFDPIECERLQTLSDNYTEGVSNTQRYKMIGNGFTIDVISHILKQIN